MELSPAAAAASSLIRSGVSLTSIYREHCRVVAELEEVKAENRRIENYFHELVEVPAFHWEAVYVFTELSCFQCIQQIRI